MGDRPAHRSRQHPNRCHHNLYRVADAVSSGTDDPRRHTITAAIADPARTRALKSVPTAPLSDGRDHRATGLGHRLDGYLAGVAGNSTIAG